jgi:hypothetical protein
MASVVCRIVLWRCHRAITPVRGRAEALRRAPADPLLPLRAGSPLVCRTGRILYRGPPGVLLALGMRSAAVTATKV